jgi:ABC-type lipoprotein release transport system permease subunit
MIVGRALVLAFAGVALGLTTALIVGRVLRNQLFGVGVVDVPTMVAVVVIAVSSTAAASFLPARRAAQLDPGNTLRHG